MSEVKLWGKREIGEVFRKKCKPFGESLESNNTMANHKNYANHDRLSKAVTLRNNYVADFIRTREMKLRTEIL